VTGEEYFIVVLRKLKTLQHTEKYVEQLEKVFEKFKQIKNQMVKRRNSSTQKLHGTSAAGSSFILKHCYR
jgi:hypothetical protein